MAKKDFRGEVWNNVDERVMSELMRINAEEVDGKVGHDRYTAAANEYLQSFFDGKIEVIYTINGTAANIIGLKALLSSYGSVICAEQAHINTYECGALEYNLGNKILTITSEDAKITPAMIDELLVLHASHGYYSQVVAITQPTELGAVYTVEEIRALADYAHEKGMKLFVDGARLGAALAALGVTLREMMADTGVDVFTVGGTKAGAMFGEAVVFTEGSIPTASEYMLKQSMQHIDKSKFLGAQMLCLFENDRWVKNFAHANDMAKLLEARLLEKGIEIYFPVQSNMVFCVLDKEALAKANKVYDLKYWYPDKKVARIATTFATKAEDVLRLVDAME